MRPRERVFRAPIWGQLREGSWPFVLAVLLPPFVAVVAFVVAAITGEFRSLWAVIGAVALAALEFGALAAKRPVEEKGCVTPCSWIALGEAHVRLGMGFFRPTFRFEQIVSVDRGRLRRGRWQPAADGSRARVRFVLREGWLVRAVAYPLSMDPLGELTMYLRLAAARNQERLRFGDEATDEDIEAVYTRLEADLRAQYPPEAAPASLGAQPPGPTPTKGSMGVQPVFPLR